MTTTQLLSTAEVAQRLERDVRTVHRMVARGELAYAYRAPTARGAYLFDPAVITALAGSTHAQGAGDASTA